MKTAWFQQVRRVTAAMMLTLASLALAAHAAGATILVEDAEGPAGPRLCSLTIDLSAFPGLFAGSGDPAKPTGLVLTELNQSQDIPAQFAPDQSGTARGTLFWIMPPGQAGPRRFALKERPAPAQVLLTARRDPATGRWDMSDAGQPILSYNYQTNEPGELLAKIAPGNRKYARPRSDYVHPLFGPHGEEMTKDWSVDHPHHRGIYWAWPEVDYRGQRGDLHALQQVFARPTGKCVGQSGAVFAQIEAENLWLWEDREPIVRERTVLRAWRADANGRCLDLEFHFTALQDDVAIARRDTKLYGGLNIRLAKVKDQRISYFQGGADERPRPAAGKLAGYFGDARELAALVVLQNPANPDYPGDWVEYPEINWMQPTFPAKGTRHLLKKDQPLLLRYRLWVGQGATLHPDPSELWRLYANPPKAVLEK